MNSAGQTEDRVYRIMRVEQGITTRVLKHGPVYKLKNFLMRKGCGRTEELRGRSTKFNNFLDNEQSKIKEHFYKTVLNLRSKECSIKIQKSQGTTKVRRRSRKVTSVNEAQLTSTHCNITLQPHSTPKQNTTFAHPHKYPSRQSPSTPNPPIHNQIRTTPYYTS